MVLSVGGARREIAIEALPGAALRVTIDGATRIVELVEQTATGVVWRDGDRLVEASLWRAGDRWVVSVGGREVVVDREDERAAIARRAARSRQGEHAGPAVLRAPIPGRVAKLLAPAGARVAAGQGVLVLEAMKMENELRAPRAGELRALHVAEGQAVEAGQELATIE